MYFNQITLSHNRCGRSYQMHCDCFIVYKQNCSLNLQLVNTWGKQNSSTGNSGVYVIPCKDCSSMYVGKLGVTLMWDSESTKVMFVSSTPIMVCSVVLDENHY